MMLGDLIAELETLPRDAVIRHGFGEPYSWRGIYADVAFKPKRNVTAGSMLTYAKEALGATFSGYKGGAYTMGEYTACHIDEPNGADGDLIGPSLIAYWRLDAEEAWLVTDGLGPLSKYQPASTE